MIKALEKGVAFAGKPENCKSTCAEKLYKLRNSIVHWNLFQEAAFKDYTDKEWNDIFKILIRIIDKLYELMDSDLVSTRRA
jgi:hypothetical protein